MNKLKLIVLVFYLLFVYSFGFTQLTNLNLIKTEGFDCLINLNDDAHFKLLRDDKWMRTQYYLAKIKRIEYEIIVSGSKKNKYNLSNLFTLIDQEIIKDAPFKINQAYISFENNLIIYNLIYSRILTNKSLAILLFEKHIYCRNRHLLLRKIIEIPFNSFSNSLLEYEYKKFQGIQLYIGSP